jgi:hypothetical protein
MLYDRKILLRKADEKGRILISEFKEREVYLVNLGSGYFVTDNKSIAEKIAENASKAFDEEFLKLVEELGISEEEVEKILEKEILKEVL